MSLDKLHTSMAELLDGAVDKKHLATGPVYVSPMAENTHQQDIIRLLKSRAPLHADRLRAHVGIAGLFNLDIAAITRPDVLVLLDNNRAMPRMWEKVGRALTSSETPDDFIISFMRDLAQSANGAQNAYACPLNDIEAYLRKDALWLSDPEAYSHMRILAKKGHFFTGVVDLLSASNVASDLGKLMRQSGLTVDTAYWSNVGQYVAPYDAEGQTLSSDGEVFKEGLRYNNYRYKSREPAGQVERWDGNMVSAGIVNRLPAYEVLLHNISEIGGAKTLHMMTSNVPAQTSFLEPPKDWSYFATPHYFEGPPRRTAEQWAVRMEAKRKHDAAASEERGAY